MKSRVIKPSKKLLKKVGISECSEGLRKCLFWFFAYPESEVSLNDLASSLSISKTNTRKIVLELVRQEFLVIKELGKLWRISCNKAHTYNYTIKIAFNLENIYLSNIIEETRKIIPNAKAIILFGSYRKGDDIEKSDIDIAVEVVGNEELSIHQLGKISQLGYRENVPVNLYIFSRNRIDINLFANIANGIVLDGFLEVRP